MQKGSKILVIGATGAMGTHVIKALLADEENEWRIKAFTRYPRSPYAKALKDLSNRVEVVEGNNNDVSTIKDALGDVKGVFCNTDYWTSGQEAESRQGKMIIEACRWAGIEHFVYSSLDWCAQITSRQMSVPVFDGKAEVEYYIAARKMSGDSWFVSRTTVLQTAPYMENFQSTYRPKLVGGQWVFTMPLEDKPWTMAALDDIGAFAAFIFAHPERSKGKTIKMASDSLTMEEIAKQFQEVTGQPAKYNKVSLEEYKATLNTIDADDIVKILSFFRQYGIERDFKRLREIYPGLLSFKDWLRKTGWSGEQREVRKK